MLEERSKYPNTMSVEVKLKPLYGVRRGEYAKLLRRDLHMSSQMVVFAFASDPTFPNYVPVTLLIVNSLAPFGVRGSPKFSYQNCSLHTNKAQPQEYIDRSQRDAITGRRPGARGRGCPAIGGRG